MRPQCPSTCSPSELLDAPRARARHRAQPTPSALEGGMGELRHREDPRPLRGARPAREPSRHPALSRSPRGRAPRQGEDPRVPLARHRLVPRRPLRDLLRRRDRPLLLRRVHPDLPGRVRRPGPRARTDRVAEGPHPRGSALPALSDGPASRRIRREPGNDVETTAPAPGAIRRRAPEGDGEKGARFAP